MTSNNVCKFLLVLLTAACVAKTAVATDVFTWQDESGVTHFSQWAPDDVRNVSRLAVNTSNPPGYDPLEDPYSIRNQAARTNETWQELAAQKKERREKIRKEREQSARNFEPRYDYHYPYVRPLTYWPVYRPIRPPMRPPGHKPTPLPAHPIARPVFSPDPMRSAHIGVRRNPPANAPARIE